jgi:hypothetical protein
MYLQFLTLHGQRPLLKFNMFNVKYLKVRYSLREATYTISASYDKNPRSSHITFNGYAWLSKHKEARQEKPPYDFSFFIDDFSAPKTFGQYSIQNSGTRSNFHPNYMCRPTTFSLSKTKTHSRIKFRNYFEKSVWTDISPKWF